MRQRTLAYNPKANGLVERLHRPLKAGLMAASKDRWTEALPVVLLGLRSSLKKELAATPAEYVLGTTIRLPGEFFGDRSDEVFDPTSYVSRLRDVVGRLIPTPTSAHTANKLFVPSALATCSHVFVRVDRVRRPLEAPYEGPFPVIARKDNYFTVRVTRRRGEVEENISLSRLKPAFMDASCPKFSTNTPAATTSPDKGLRTPDPESTSLPVTSSSDESNNTSSSTNTTSSTTTSSTPATSQSTSQTSETDNTKQSPTTSNKTSSSQDTSSTKATSPPLRRSPRRKVTFNTSVQTRHYNPNH